MSIIDRETVVKHFFFGFRNKELITVVISEMDEVENAIDVDYYVEKPQEPMKQLTKWLKKQRVRKS